MEYHACIINNLLRYMAVLCEWELAFTITSTCTTCPRVMTCKYTRLKTCCLIKPHRGDYLHLTEVWYVLSHNSSCLFAFFAGWRFLKLEWLFIICGHKPSCPTQIKPHGWCSKRGRLGRTLVESSSWRSTHRRAEYCRLCCSNITKARSCNKRE